MNLPLAINHHPTDQKKTEKFYSTLPIEWEEIDMYVWAMMDKTIKIDDLFKSNIKEERPQGIASPMFCSPVGTEYALAAAVGWRTAQTWEDTFHLWGHLGRGWMYLGFGTKGHALAYRNVFTQIEGK